MSKQPWDDVDVMLLKKRWAAGFSAGQIAASFEGKYTRNSIVGKVHRLALSKDQGLRASRIKNGGEVGEGTKAFGGQRAARNSRHANRAKSSPPHIVAWQPHEDAKLTELWNQGANAEEISAQLTDRTPGAVNTRVAILGLGRHRFEKSICTEPLPPEKAEPNAKRIPLRDLGEGQCRWPIGDPRRADFGFCGADKVPGLPYCAHHALRSCETPEGGQRLLKRAARAAGVKTKKREMETA